MSLNDELSDYALSLPGAYMTEQWQGAHVFKISDDKMFAILRPDSPKILVKLPDIEVRAMLVEAGVAEIHSHLKRGSWANLLTGKLDLEDILARLTISYELVRTGLSKSRQAALPPYPKFSGK